MTIRENVSAEIGGLLRRVNHLHDDDDISVDLRLSLKRVSERLDQCISIMLPHDNGPTAADIAGEVVHVPAPF